MRINERGNTRLRAADIHAGETSVIEGLRRELADAGLDCQCEDRAEHFFDQVQAIRRAGALRDACGMRDAIAIAMVLLAELDELTADETDLSVYGEIACLFEDIADYASRGAVFSRLLAIERDATREGVVQ